MPLKSSTYLALVFICSIIISCSKYIDITKNKTHVPIMQGYLDFYPDSNILFYKTNVGLTSDMEKKYPKAFKVKLPKGLKFYELSNSTDFIFYYNKRQAVVINIDADYKEITGDSVYFPTKAELDNFILYNTSTSNHNYNIKEIPMKSMGKQVFIKKGAATILLYNIEPKNYDLFFKYVNSFSFIEQ
jgi:hypothetical protein